MIRVLHCISDSNVGGAGRLLVHFLRHLDRTQWEPVVALPRDSALIPMIRETDTRIIETDFGRDASHEAGGISGFRRLIRAEQPQIVHTHSSLDARIAAWQCGVKSRIYTRHSVFESSRRLTTFPGKQIAGTINNLLATRIIAVADAAADNLTVTGVNPKKITVILNGVDPLSPGTAEARAALRASLGIQPDDFVCGISARFVECKGHMDLLAAAQQVCAAREHVRFLMMGNGPVYEETRRAAVEMGLESRVIFTGFLPNVTEYYPVMNLALNASYGTEATSLALIEAMSLGIPAVATRFGGNPGVIADEVNGLLVPIRAPASMAYAILRLIDDSSLYDRLCVGAKNLFGEKFTASAMTVQIEKLYTEEAIRCGWKTRER